jgi:hypothetical protein
MSTTKYRTRTLGGSLLVIKGLNDCVTIERGNNGKPQVVSVEGEWDSEELDDAKHKWFTQEGAEARRR